MENAVIRENDSTDADEQQAARALASRRRADTYRFLADVFVAEPTAKMLDSLRRPEAVKAFETLGIAIADELNRMEADLGRDRLVEELEHEYTRLFIGPGKHVGPHESLHRDDHPPEHWGPSTAEVKRFIEHHGLGYAQGFQGMPDHISAEFQFVSMLADAEADAIEQAEDEKADQARKIQQTFQREHLVRWVPVFCDKVIELTNLGFYRDFARMSKAIVEVDAVELDAEELAAREEL